MTEREQALRDVGLWLERNDINGVIEEGAFLDDEFGKAVEILKQGRMPENVSPYA